MGPDDLYLALQLIRFPIIVGIQKGDPVKARPVYSEIAGTGCSPVGFSEEPDRCPVGLDGAGELCAVRTTIVDN